MTYIRLIGELSIERDGRPLMLPPSRKTRALLAYLALTGRPHRRERLCALLWEVPDDPRGALRWSLSKLRPLVDEPDRVRIVATRETVAFQRLGAGIDILDLRDRLAAGLETIPTEDLEDCARAFRGELLEGLDLPDLHDFQTWCLAERDDARTLQAGVLGALVQRFAHRPEDALPYARALVQVDPFSTTVRADLLRLLVDSGRRGEAEQQFDAAMRLFRELGEDATASLARAWRDLRDRPRPPEPEIRGPSRPAVAPPARPAPEPSPAAKEAGLVGRRTEWSRLVGILDRTVEERRSHAVLLKGEPGLGKSRLVAELARAVEGRNGTVLGGRAYEAGRSQPYGPWAEALNGLPLTLLGASTEPALVPLLPDPAQQTDRGAARERLFATVAEAVSECCARHGPPVLLALDDIHWCDEASSALLHHVTRALRDAPLMVVLTARDGELQENPAILGVLRSLRQDRRLDEIALSPLSREETARLVHDIAPDADAGRVFAESGGNPLFAQAMARAHPNGSEDMPRTLRQLVRDRIDRLPPATAEVLRWAAILGPSVPTDPLSRLAPFDLDEFMAALETLERYGLLREASVRGESGHYAFAHDLIHRAVYTSLSEPRRRLMHGKAARVLQELGGGDEAVAADIAHHAALAGDSLAAAGACVAAGRRCLRFLANVEAESHARRGMRYAERLREPDRTKLALELLQIQFAARRPDDPAEAARSLERLAETALDHNCLEHARLGYHLLSWLRWEGGLWPDAERDMLRAELVSRSADERERVIALSEAARCLALLERDLGQAEAFLLEARALAQRLGVEPDAIPDATGMLRLHQGQFDEAARLFRHARALARRDGDRTNEFLALEHLVALEIQRGRLPEAEMLCGEMADLANRLRQGSEAPYARALGALCRLARGMPEAEAELAEAIDAIRVADAKHRLAFVLSRAAELDLRAGNLHRGRPRAEEAFRLATLLDLPSEMAMAHALLARIAERQHDPVDFARHANAIRALLPRGLSNPVRTVAERLLGKLAEAKATAVPEHRAS